MFAQSIIVLRRILTMVIVAKSLCEECEQVVGISTRGEPIQQRDGKPVGTSCWWYLDVHAKDGKLCEGSGKRI